VRQTGVGEQVEAREPEPPEQEQADAATVEPEGAPPLDRCEHDEEEQGRCRIPQRRQIEGVDVAQGGLADDPLPAPVKELAAGGEQACGAMPLPVSASTRSHHLRILREAGLTVTRVEGTQRMVSLRRDDLESRFPGLLDAVLR